MRHAARMSWLRLCMFIALSFPLASACRTHVTFVDDDADCEVHDATGDLPADATPALDAEVVAEGIGSEEDLKTLIDLGVSFGQGYY